MDKNLAVYEPPMLAEVGDFAELTHGTQCKCNDAWNITKFGADEQIEWLWDAV
jgi:hypothetical protein